MPGRELGVKFARMLLAAEAFGNPEECAPNWRGFPESPELGFGALLGAEGRIRAAIEKRLELKLEGPKRIQFVKRL